MEKKRKKFKKTDALVNHYRKQGIRHRLFQYLTEVFLTFFENASICKSICIISCSDVGYFLSVHGDTALFYGAARLGPEGVRPDFTRSERISMGPSVKSSSVRVTEGMSAAFPLENSAFAAS